MGKVWDGKPIPKGLCGRAGDGSPTAFRMMSKKEALSVAGSGAEQDMTILKTDTSVPQIPIALSDVLDFIREAPPEDFRRIHDAVREVEGYHLERLRQRFKPGDMVEWTISKNAGLAEYFKGKVVAVNRTCCVVAVIANYAPLRYRYCRAPFELLQHVE